MILISFAVLTFGFSLFAAINFFSTRYLFAVIPLMLIACAIFISSISKSYYAITIISIIGVLGSINIYRSTENKSFGDTDLSYTDLLKVQVKMVDYLQKSNFKEQIYSQV